MSRKVEDTEIYRYSHQVSIISINIVKNMDNKFKTTLGDRLVNNCLDLLELVCDSSKSSDKMEYLENVSVKISKISLLSRLCSDLKLCSFSAQAQLLENLMLVESNASKWRSYLKRKSKLLETLPQGDETR